MPLKINDICITPYQGNVAAFKLKLMLIDYMLAHDYSFIERLSAFQGRLWAFFEKRSNKSCCKRSFYGKIISNYMFKEFVYGC